LSGPPIPARAARGGLDTPGHDDEGGAIGAIPVSLKAL
jgi:hypothetical protein